MGSNRDLNPLVILPDLEKDPSGFQAALQQALDDLAFHTKRAMVWTETSGGLYLAVDPSLPTNPQRGHAYFDGTSDVGKIYDGAWKRLGTPVPIWKQYTGADLTFAIPLAGWVEINTGLTITYTPVQKIVVVADFSAHILTDIAAVASINIRIAPAPADVIYLGDYSGASSEDQQLRHCRTVATLTANTAYTLTPSLSMGGGPGTITMRGSANSDLHLATFHPPA